jgi:hypothetical protein
MPSPIGGLNLVDPIDQMDPSDALSLENIVPNGLSCMVRKGYTLLNGKATSGYDVETLEGIANTDGTYQVIAGTDSDKHLYRVTSGAFTSIGGPYGSASFNADTFGSTLFLCNGIDNVQAVTTGAAADSTFSGVTLSNLINVGSFKERVYFVEKSTLKIWYGNTRAVGGSALASYDFAFAMKDGGYLVSCGSFSNNYADTTQDLFYALSSEGEILFYTGSSPADVTTPWGLVKRCKIGKPLGYRAFVEIENDVWLLTDQGIVPITALFSSEPSVAIDTIGKKINPLISLYAATVPFSGLWHGSYFPKERKVYIVVPTSTGLSTILLVYSLVGGTWTTYTFSGNNIAYKVMSIAGYLFYGGALGNVYNAETGYTDISSAINFSGRGAFSFYGNRGLWKAYRDIRPLIKTVRGLTLSLGLDTDFKQTSDISTVSPGVGVYTAWGSAWGSPWSSGVEYIYDRHALKGQGYSASIKFRGSINNAPLEINAFDIRFTQGTW